MAETPSLRSLYQSKDPAARRSAATGGHRPAGPGEQAWAGGRRQKVGAIHETRTVSGGYNSEIAARLTTDSGTIFLKGLSCDHPRSWTQRREAEVAPYTGILAPNFRWRLEVCGWDLLAFEFVDGHHADYTAGSPDLRLLAVSLTRLAALPAPPLDLKRAENRWSKYLPDPRHRAAVAGSTLCHTDFNPENVLITPSTAVLADWAWATLAAPWVDAALGCIWLIATGRQTPAQAETWASQMPAWRTAPADALSAFATANALLWSEIADESPGSWSISLRDAARRYAAFRAR